MKLWKDCSNQEKREVKAIENKLNYLKKRFKEGKMPLTDYLSQTFKLEERLNEVERKYDTKDC